MLHGSNPATEPGPDRVLAEALLDPAALGHAVEGGQLIETHISWVLLTGRYAYKLRKPVTLPFVDFSDPQARRLDCEHELALNRRWAPELYLDVVPIRGSTERPTLVGPGPVIEHAVRMRQFPQRARLDRVAARGELTPEMLAALARDLAAVHANAPAVDLDSELGTPELFRRQAMDNFDALGVHAVTQACDVDAIRSWTESSLSRLAPVLHARRGTGRVRECHGDLHLANLVLVDGRVLPFDGLEFAAELRWVDLMSDLAFLLMDLEHRGLAAGALTVLDEYLQQGGDYDGLCVLPLFRVYRALVRAKVAALRETQLAERSPAEAALCAEECTARLRTARAAASDDRGRLLVVTHGLSGSGKSWLARHLAVPVGALRLRSDVERARLTSTGSRRYDAATTARVYARLRRLAAQVIEGGYAAIVDATFLDARERSAFRALARDLGVAFRILDVSAPDAVLVSRIENRLREGRDASEADRNVLDAQRRNAEPLTAHERADTVSVDSSIRVDFEQIVKELLAT